MYNYSYDKIGNLVADKSEEIEEISWTMQGKVKEIRRIGGSQKPDLVFNYDGLGNRVSKTVIPKNSVNSEDSITTYYVRDAQGNILATYEKTKYKNGDEKFYLKEQYLYGSSRIGMKVSNQLLASNVNGNVEIKEYDGYFTKEIGNKRYELTNHLGNVLAVVSDKKGADNEPDVVSVSDYYPFGMTMPGRLYSEPSNSYRFGYNTQEKTDEVAGAGNHYTAQFWEYNPQVVQRWNLDPKPNPSMSFYATFAGNPIINNDILGDTLHVRNNTDSKNDIESIVKNKNKEFINYSGETLNIDFGNMSEKEISRTLKKDKGLNLLYNMSNAPENIYFETTNQRFEMQDRIDAKQTWYYQFPSASAKDNVMNLSTTPRNIDGGIEDEGHIPVNSNYQGHIAIRPGNYSANGDKVDNAGKVVGTFTLIIPRASIVFHELYENYRRTCGGQPYMRPDGTGAHQDAINAAGNSFGLEKDNQGKAQNYVP